MTEAFEPELGQAMFGQPTQEFECPAIMESVLLAISQELHRVLWNLKQEEIDPFGNTGEAFRCDTFGAWAYSWGEDDSQPYNFCHPKTGLKISWYKYQGRGMSCNMEVSPGLAAEVLEDCLKAVRSFDIKLTDPADIEPETRAERPFLVGYNGTVPYFEQAQSPSSKLKTEE